MIAVAPGATTHPVDPRKTNDRALSNRLGQIRQKMRNDRYSMSFTTGTLFHRESVQLAGLYLELDDWHLVRARVIAENLLQARTMNTLKRVCREVISRLKRLTVSELRFLMQGSHQDQAYLLWIALCRRYRLIADFSVEVVRERYISLKGDISQADFDVFFNRKSEWHSELESVRPSTRAKLRQVLFKMLREANLLTAENLIIAAMFGPELSKLISRHNQTELAYFPVFDSDLKWKVQ
jgi:hypothetical protein